MCFFSRKTATHPFTCIPLEASLDLANMAELLMYDPVANEESVYIYDQARFFSFIAVVS